MSVLVTNEPFRMCCGQLSRECRCHGRKASRGADGRTRRRGGRKSPEDGEVLPADYREPIPVGNVRITQADRDDVMPTPELFPPAENPVLNEVRESWAAEEGPRTNHNEPRPRRGSGSAVEHREWDQVEQNRENLRRALGLVDAGEVEGAYRDENRHRLGLVTNRRVTAKDREPGLPIPGVFA